ncbi:YheC/YheD family protein [Bacillus sp. S/N-304-OC-R1]|uniref:YheC/YheD family endospore coat-associated protein n=1 Tax=Bacillus sp. S/N-304-OC-R1 TaxID=2758034 RepID=UPI001C8E1562|nr:YheC/YheD family protein [Bacillus sp. S/N-304-OC-R1]MBY0123097.1 YheC/YheD family protein [Bacillus sp. S/N-304-OC-R1]
MTLSLIPITIVPAKVFQKTDNTIKISHPLIQYWRLNTAKPVVLVAGKKQIIANIEAAHISKEEIFISESIFEELELPAKETRLITSFSHKEHRITFGPIIGLLTEIEYLENTQPHFRSIHSFCKEMHDVISQIGGFFYVFSFMDYSDGTINGYYFDHDNWIKFSAPLPDVIYNRIHSRKLEASISFQKFKANMFENNIPIFNDQFLSKDIVHNLLAAEEYLHLYLPKTVSASEKTIEDLMNQYDSIYIKPVHGSQGRNIIKVSRSNHVIQAELSTARKNEHIHNFNSFDQFSKWISPFLKKRTYIAQQGVPLVKYKNNQLDFRILCHRNLHNSWMATSAVARISAEDQFVSNIARGGEIMKPIHVLSNLSSRKTAIQQLALMKELAVETSSIISQRMDGLIGELGIDIGVDDNEKLWIIEVNAKPSKNFEEHTNKIRPSSKALLQYCTYLAFSKKK